MQPVQEKELRFDQDNLDFTDASLSLPEFRGNTMVVHARNVAVDNEHPDNSTGNVIRGSDVRIVFRGVTLSKRTMQIFSADELQPLEDKRDVIDFSSEDSSQDSAQIHYLAGVVSREGSQLDVADLWEVHSSSATVYMKANR